MPSVLQPVLQLVARYADWFYLISLVGLFIYGRAFLQARRRTQEALFELERESAVGERRRTLFATMLFIGLAAGVYSVNRWVAPTLPPLPVAQTTPTPEGPFITAPPLPSRPPPTPTITATPTPPPTLEHSPTPSQTATHVVTATPETPTAAPTQPPSVGVPPNCASPNVALTSPGDGADVSGVVQVYGQAQLDNFNFYKFELNGAGTGNAWITLSTYSSPASGFLGSWNAAPFTSGPYAFRLVVVRQDGNYEQCAVSLVISAPPP
jgi:hypothetical protein